MAKLTERITAIVLAAGHGKRLMPITQWIPKPLVPVNGKPILLTNLQHLSDAGLERAVVVYGRPTAFIPDFLEGMRFGELEVQYGFQTEQRGTGDALLTGMNLVPDSGNYLLMAGDTMYSLEHIGSLLDRFAEGDVEGCLLLKELPFERLRHSSVVLQRPDGTIESMISKPSASELRALRSNRADASLQLYRGVVADYLRRAELSRSNELEVTTALRDWIAAGARIAGVVGATPPHITDPQDFITFNIPFGRRFVAISEIEQAIQSGEDCDITGVIQSLEPVDVPFVYKRLKKLSRAPMGATKQARVLALISEVFRYQAHQQGFATDPELEVRLERLHVPEFIGELEPLLAASVTPGAAYHYLAVAYARYANKFVADSVFSEALSRMPDAAQPAELRNRVVVKTPARLSFSSSQGSDISYIIEEKGAVILNCAITVKGEYPGIITLERIGARHIELVAADIGATGIITQYDDFLGHIAPSDPLILLKAGLRFSGVIDPSSAPDLEQWLGMYGTGIRITVHCAIAKGSGLGCSAILAAGLVRGMREFAGLETDQSELLVRSYCCERYYGRSGYQDIIGGAVGGVKMVQADGLTALFAPRIEPLELSAEQVAAIGRNLIVFYTGRPHMNTPYLLTIPAKYFTRSSDYMYAYENGKQLTHAMSEALRTDDWERMGALISGYWDDREFFEEGVTPDFARRFRSELAPLSYGTALCGSGHGGYMMVVPRPAQRDAILECLARCGVTNDRILDFDVSAEGLVVEAE